MTDRAASIRKDGALIRETAIENALARLVRQRWPSNTIENVAAEWNLTKGRAANVVYAHASMASLNVIIGHRRGGWPIVIAIFEQVVRTQLQTWIQQEVESLERTSRIAAREAERLGELERSLDRIAVHGVGRGQDRQLDIPPNAPAASGRDECPSMGGADT